MIRKISPSCNRITYSITFNLMHFSNSIPLNLFWAICNISFAFYKKHYFKTNTIFATILFFLSARPLPTDYEPPEDIERCWYMYSNNTGECKKELAYNRLTKPVSN